MHEGPERKFSCFLNCYLWRGKWQALSCSCYLHGAAHGALQRVRQEWKTPQYSLAPLIFRRKGTNAALELLLANRQAEMLDWAMLQATP